MKAIVPPPRREHPAFDKRRLIYCQQSVNTADCRLEHHNFGNHSPYRISHDNYGDKMPKIDSTGPIEPNQQAPEYTANGIQVVEALFKEVVQELDAQKAANKPYDPHLHALMKSLYTTSITMYSDLFRHDMDWQKHEIVDKLWQNLPQDEIKKGQLGEDPFFQDAERLMNDFDYYKAPDPETAAEDFAREWMETYHTNKDINANANAGAQQSIDETAKLKKLLGDHDQGMDAHPERMTQQEYSKYQSEKLDRERRQAIWDGRTERPKWMALYSKAEIENIEKMRRQEESKRKRIEQKQRQIFLEKGGKDIDFKEKVKKDYEVRRYERESNLKKDKRRPRNPFLRPL